MSKPEIEFDMMEEMYAASCMCRKDIFFRKRRVDHSGVGGTAFIRVYPARANTTLVVLVMIYGIDIHEMYATFGTYIWPIYE